MPCIAVTQHCSPARGVHIGNDAACNTTRVGLIIIYSSCERMPQTKTNYTSDAVVPAVLALLGDGSFVGVFAAANTSRISQPHTSASAVNMLANTYTRRRLALPCWESSRQCSACRRRAWASPSLQHVHGWVSRCSTTHDVGHHIKHNRSVWLLTVCASLSVAGQLDVVKL